LAIKLSAHGQTLNAASYGTQNTASTNKNCSIYDRKLSIKTHKINTTAKHTLNNEGKFNATTLQSSQTVL